MYESLAFFHSLPGVWGISQIEHQTRKSYVHIGVKIPMLQLYTLATSIDFNENENGMEKNFAACFEAKTPFALMFSLL